MKTKFYANIPNIMTNLHEKKLELYKDFEILPQEANSLNTDLDWGDWDGSMM